MFEEEEEAPPQSNWLTSYSDMISLLFALFVVLYGMSKVNEESFRQLSEALSKSLSTGGLQTKVPHKKNATDNVMEKRKFKNLQSEILQAVSQSISLKRLEELQQLKAKLEKDLAAKGLKKFVSIHIEERGMVISLLTDNLLFDLGKADVKGQCSKILHIIAPTLRKYKNPVRIEGNTCNLPIKTAEFDSNWELSAARSTNVAKFLIFKEKIDADRISIVGYGEFKPKFPNDNERNRSKNRRVDVVILEYEIAGKI